MNLNQNEREIYSNFLNGASELLIIDEILNFRKEIEMTPTLYNEFAQNIKKIEDVATQTNLFAIDVAKLYNELNREFKSSDQRIMRRAYIYRSLFKNEIEFLKWACANHASNNSSKNHYTIKNFQSSIYKRSRRHHIYFDEINETMMRDPKFNNLKLKFKSN